MTLIRYACLDWGGTLMSEDGPADVPMAYWPDVKVIDGAREMLEILCRAHTLCLATNATVSKRADIELALARGGLGEFFSDIFCFTEMNVKKSTPEFWSAVTERLRCSPGEIAMLGDSLQEDVLGPSKQGVFAVWFNPERREVPPGVRSVERLADFAALIATPSDRTTR